jgi:alpha-beta hydrolase superfamily lysophospholipase
MNTQDTLGALAGAYLLMLANAALAADAANSCIDHAQAILKAMDGGDFEGARVKFDANMKEHLGADQLQAVWASLPSQAGARLAVAPGRVMVSGDTQVAIIPIHHEKTWLELQVSCTAADEVNGLYVRPGKDPAVATLSAPTPAYADPAKFEEHEHRFTSDGLTFAGTLTLPHADHAVPAVVLVHGSGPHDRDETVSGNKPFRDLAQGLASRGIAVLRYEKRTQAHPQSFSGKVYTVKEEVVTDALAAIASLGDEKAIDGKRIFVIGHSLGAMLAPRIARDAPHLAGMVLLAAPARGLIDIIPFQLDYLANLDGKVDDAEREQAKQVNAVIAQVKAFGDEQRNDTTPVMGAPAAYWIDLANYDPIAETRALKRPTLLLQGEGDFQVTMKEDFAPWVAAFAKESWFASQSFPGVGHLYTPAGKKPGPTDYDQPANVDVAVIDAIAHWIL